MNNSVTNSKINSLNSYYTKYENLKLTKSTIGKVNIRNKSTHFPFISTQSNASINKHFTTNNKKIDLYSNFIKGPRQSLKKNNKA